MKFTVLTLFKEMFNALNTSIISRAKEEGKISIECIDMRDFSKNKHKKVDDYPYGGGAGMVIRPDIVYDAYNSINEDIRKNSKVIHLSPRGKVLTQEKVKQLAEQQNIIFICGHYEGIDQRVLDMIVDEEISIGDYILTGGEIPAMVIIDSVSRYVDGVISKDSLEDESFSNGMLEYSQYTRPEVFEGIKVPEVLLSGNHKKIKQYREDESLKITLEKRPELLKKEENKTDK